MGNWPHHCVVLIFFFLDSSIAEDPNLYFNSNPLLEYTTNEDNINYLLQSSTTNQFDIDLYSSSNIE